MFDTNTGKLDWDNNVLLLILFYGRSGAGGGGGGGGGGGNCCWCWWWGGGGFSACNPWMVRGANGWGVIVWSVEVLFVTLVTAVAAEEADCCYGCGWVIVLVWLVAWVDNSVFASSYVVLGLPCTLSCVLLSVWEEWS